MNGQARRAQSKDYLRVYFTLHTRRWRKWRSKSLLTSEWFRDETLTLSKPRQGKKSYLSLGSQTATDCLTKISIIYCQIPNNLDVLRELGR